ncbi:hypothetical protein MP638_004467, partial [Amoeboaphelidium occidentale]
FDYKCELWYALWISLTFRKDIEERYERLLHEYTKLKAQNSVLKKAIISEQTTMQKIEKELQLKENDYRKNAQELDSLKFHNQRLVKRIEAMQEELAQPKQGSWILGSTSSSKKEFEKLKLALEASNADLVKKINENESLHKALDELEHSRSSERNDMVQRNETLQKQLADLKDEFRRSMTSSEDQIIHLRRKNTELEKFEKKLKTDKRDAFTDTIASIVERVERGSDAYAFEDPKMVELEGKLKSLSLDLATVETERKSLESSLSELKEKLNESEHNLLRKNAEANALRTSIAQKDEMIAGLNENISGLRKEIEELKVKPTVTNVETLTEQEEHVSVEVQTMEPSSNFLKKEVRVQGLVVQVPEELVDKSLDNFNDAHKLRSEYETRLDDLHKQLSEADSFKTRMAQEYKTIFAAKEVYEMERKTCTAQIKEMEAQIRELKAKGEEAEANFAKQVATMTEYVEFLKGQVKESNQV